jgi:hypothetical protein
LFYLGVHGDALGVLDAVDVGDDLAEGQVPVEALEHLGVAEEDRHLVVAHLFIEGLSFERELDGQQTEAD